MIDTLHPFAQALQTESASDDPMPGGRLDGGTSGGRDRHALDHRHGQPQRARLPAGRAAAGHQDAGATSIYYVLQSFGAALSTPD